MNIVSLVLHLGVAVYFGIQVFIAFQEGDTGILVIRLVFLVAMLGATYWNHWRKKLPETAPPLDK